MDNALVKTTVNNSISCSRCGSTFFVKSGGARRKNGEKIQIYLCKKCMHHFRDRRGYGFKMKHSQEVVDFAVSLSSSENPAYSTRDIARRVYQKFGVKVSNVAVSRWISQAGSQKRLGRFLEYEKKKCVKEFLVIPCFRCLLNKEVSPAECAPSNCGKLEIWLISSC